MPTENTTSSSEATCSLPPSTSFANDGNCVRNTAPKNHIHEMPSSERNTTTLSLAGSTIVFDVPTQTATFTLGTLANLHAAYSLTATGIHAVSDAVVDATSVAGTAAGGANEIATKEKDFADSHVHVRRTPQHGRPPAGCKLETSFVGPHRIE